MAFFARFLFMTATMAAASLLANAGAKAAKLFFRRRSGS